MEILLASMLTLQKYYAATDNCSLQNEFQVAKISIARTGVGGKYAARHLPDTQRVIRKRRFPAEHTNVDNEDKTGSR
jgi:hypothetical protein